MFLTKDPKNLVNEGHVSIGPTEARNKIELHYKCILTLNGNSCTGIENIRNIINNNQEIKRLNKCIFVTAPHTHWGPDAIIESFDANRNVYIAGPIASQDRLRPFSFIFSKEGPIPYEWLDQSVPISDNELNQAYILIHSLNAIIASSMDINLPIPLGISIDHRFKASIWDEQVLSFSEGPSDEENNRALINPVIISVISNNEIFKDQVQVAWSTFSHEELLAYPLEPNEYLEISRLESLLKSLKPEDAMIFLRELDDSLSSS